MERRLLVPLTIAQAVEDDTRAFEEDGNPTRQVINCDGLLDTMRPRTLVGIEFAKFLRLPPVAGEPAGTHRINLAVRDEDRIWWIAQRMLVGTDPGLKRGLFLGRDFVELCFIQIKGPEQQLKIMGIGFAQPLEP